MEYFCLFLNYLKMNIFSPVGEWICNIFRKKQSEPEQNRTVFYASEYLSRIERASLEIMENREPVDMVIILWWGLDGLRLNEDGTMEWISRKKPELVNQNVSYQPCQCKIAEPLPSTQLNFANLQTQSTKEEIDELTARIASLQIKSEQTAQNAAIMSLLRPPMPPLASPLQQCCIQYPVQYPPYYYGGCCRF